MSTTYTALRYPGGKSSLYGFLSQVIKYNDIKNCIYIEPYAGGAGAAIKLLIKGVVKEIILNDADDYIMNFWHSILYQTDKFILRIKETEVNIKEWQRQHNLLFKSKKRKKANELSYGFATFYLNRCNWSGILDARPIGGMKQEGKWKIDARFNKDDLIRKIQKISELRHRIQLYNMDALDLLQEIKKNDNIDVNTCLVYMDPPYYIKGPSLYRKNYDNEDHLKLARYIKNETSFKWMLSYDDVNEIHEIYKEFSRNVLNLNYFAHSIKIGKELIMASYSCLIPEQFVLYAKRNKFVKSTENLNKSVRIS